jgi:hypothetical protein
MSSIEATKAAQDAVADDALAKILAEQGLNFDAPADVPAKSIGS